MRNKTTVKNFAELSDEEVRNLSFDEFLEFLEWAYPKDCYP